MKKSLRRLLISILALVVMAGMGSSVFAAEDGSTELSITNNTGMFKAVSASLEASNDNTVLKMALSGDGYQKLYKGTYEQAVANGANTDNWINGYKNDAGKWEFQIPISEGETYVPVVAISNRYYTTYLEGQNSLERAFYPRQIEINAQAKTLVTGDYEYDQQLEVTNNVKKLKVSAANLHTVGGPNSNNYASDLILTMGSDSYSEVYVGSFSEANAAEKTIALAEGNVFTVPVKWVETFGNPETLKSLTGGEPFYLSLKSRKNGTWYERIAMVDEANGSLVLNESKADYTAVDAAIASIPADLEKHTSETAEAVTAAKNAVVTGKPASQQSEVDAMAKAINDAVAALISVNSFEYEGEDVAFIKEDGAAFGMLSPQEGSTWVFNDGKVDIHIIPKNTTVYGWIHWGMIDDEELTKDITMESNGEILMSLDYKMCGRAHPVAPIKKDGATTSAQYYIAVPSLEKISGAENFVAAQAAIDTVKADPANKENVMAALDAIDKLTDGEKACLEDGIVEVNTAKTAIDNKEAAEAAIAEAKADPANKEKVEAALAAIEKLTDEQKEALKDDIEAVNAAKTAIDNKEAAEEAIAEVKADPANKEKVEAALAAIDKLTEEQKAALKDDIAAVNAAKTAIDNKEAAEAAIAAAKANPTNKAKVEAALAAISKLTDEQKAALADDIKAVNNAKTAIEKKEKANQQAAKDKAAATKVKATKIKLKKVKAGKKSFTVTWKKNANVDGYQVWYKTGSKAKTVKIAKKNATKKVVKKLKKGKKYTVKVRGYKKIGGKMVYTKWSSAKKVKIKK